LAKFQVEVFWVVTVLR